MRSLSLRRSFALENIYEINAYIFEIEYFIDYDTYVFLDLRKRITTRNYSQFLRLFVCFTSARLEKRNPTKFRITSSTLSGGEVSRGR